MEKFDDNASAKEAVASSPDITEGVLFDDLEGGSNADQIAVEKAVYTAPSEADKRNSRLLSRLAKEATKFIGCDPDEDQLDAAEEISSEGFYALSSLNPPRWLKVGLTLSLLLGSFLPTFFITYSAWSGKENKND